jgi:quinol monooxygenase YgiN
MKIILAKLQAKEGRLAGLRAACLKMLDPSRAEPGCISYAFSESIENPGEITFFEEWQDQAAIDSHFSTDHFLAFGPAIEEDLQDPPAVTIYDVAGEPEKV